MRLRCSSELRKCIRIITQRKRYVREREREGEREIERESEGENEYIEQKGEKKNKEIYI